MELPRAPHSWTVSPRQAVTIQKQLASRVRRSEAPGAIRRVAGVDAAFSRDGARILAGVVLWDVDEQRVVEQHVASRLLRFPYVPGLLSFREAPGALAALGKLRRRPDALLFDGHGIAHPRRFGIASHVGVICGLPSVGCGKSRLVGTFVPPGTRRGSRSPLRDRGETIGAVLRTRDDTKPVFVSVGHRFDLRGAERLVLRCGGGYRLPEPTRLADQLVARAKRGAA